MHQKKIGIIYMREMMASLTVYAVLLVATIKYGRPMEPGVLRTVVLLSPMIGFALAGWAVVRQLHRVDEFILKSVMEDLALAAMVVAALSFSYGFLETAGYPTLSMFYVWPVMGAAWGLITCVRNLIGR